MENMTSIGSRGKSICLLKPNILSQFVIEFHVYRIFPESFQFSVRFVGTIKRQLMRHRDNLSFLHTENCICRNGLLDDIIGFSILNAVNYIQEG